MSDTTCVNCFRPGAGDVDIVFRGDVVETIKACDACVAIAHASILDTRAVFDELVSLGQCEYDANRGVIAKSVQSDAVFDVPKNGPNWRGLICWPPSLELFS